MKTLNDALHLCKMAVDVKGDDIDVFDVAGDSDS